MAADARGYYAALGLHPGEPIDSVRTAYRRLAKECHPDSSSCRDGGARFREITEAYDALSDERFKASYDKQSEPEDVSRNSASTQIEPVCCDVCGKVTAQPRRLAFWRVTSFILVSSRHPVQKIFCRQCAAREQWKSTLWTSLLGWWGIPWGPVWSIGHGFTNAVGGSRETSVDERLMWRNAVAFASRGDGEIAVALSNVLRKSDDVAIAQSSADIIRFYGQRGVAAGTTIRDPWQGSLSRTTALFLVAFAVPAAALAFVVLPTGGYVTPSPEYAATDTASNGPYSDLIPAQPSSADPVEEAQAEPVPPPATCKSPPGNGEILIDRRGSTSEGHVLEIKNGSRGDAIIKLRDASTSQTVASFFVSRGNSASLTEIPDGIYAVQYAMGDKLTEDCRTFVDDGTATASEFPGTDELATRYQEELGGTTVIRGKLTYTLYSVPYGNVRPAGISMDSFNEP